MSDPAILFDTGFVVRTPKALLALIAAQVSETSLIQRHLSGDFGELPAEDADANRSAIAHGGRVCSRYRLGPQTVVWVITEADRSATTLLLPSEY